tara:strand:+ start:2230 stop:2889 length:660 start_codon:yes stop_codon:yes gene_type:complete
MAKVVSTQAEGDEPTTEETTETKPEASTTEQLGVTVEAFEEVKKAQAGSDRKYREVVKINEELRSELKQQKQEKEDSEKSLSEKNAAEIARMNERAEKAEQRAAKETLRANALQEFTKLNVPVELDGVELLDLFKVVGDEESSTQESVAAVHEYLEAYHIYRQQDVLKANGRIPLKTEPEGDRYYSPDQLNNMSEAEKDENWDKYIESYKYYQDQARRA